jgi:hypothetical protein
MIDAYISSHAGTRHRSTLIAAWPPPAPDPLPESLEYAMLALLTAVSLAAAAPTRVDTAADSSATRAAADSTRPTPMMLTDRIAPAGARVAADTGGSRRVRAVEYSDWYARRLAVHRVASYAMLPLFVGEYVLGQRLIAQQNGAANGTDYVRSSTRNLHQVTAGGIAALFGINTVTGLWNLYDARHDPAGRRLRVAHTALMLAADAGFAVTGIIAGNAKAHVTSNGDVTSNANAHRNAALVSMGIGTVGTAIMWFRHD